MAKKAKKSDKKEVYLRILDNYEKEKGQILRAYMIRITKAKKAGLKKLEVVMGKEEEAAAKKMLDDL